MFAQILRWLAGRWVDRTNSRPVAVAASAVAPSTTASLAVATSGTQAVWVSDGARKLMLAARLASVAKLNVKAGRPQQTRASGSLSAIPVSRIGAKKQRRCARNRRLFSSAARPSAEIIAFPSQRRSPAGQLPARKAA